MSHSYLSVNYFYAPKTRIDFVVVFDELFIIIIDLLPKSDSSGVNNPHTCFYVTFPTAPF